MRCVPQPKWADAHRVHSTAIRPIDMPETSSSVNANCNGGDGAAGGGASGYGAGVRHVRVGDACFAALVFLVLARPAQVRAAEQPALIPNVPQPNFNPTVAGTGPLLLNPPAFDLPRSLQANGVPLDDLFSPSDFRPRGNSVLQHPVPATSLDATPQLRVTSVWQRLVDYRSHGRVRLLTLWETGGSSVSLQAGKKGQPSLQWTSRSMNRGGATRGVFDQLLSISVAGAGRSLRPTRSIANEPPTRAVKTLEAGFGPNK